MHPPLPSRLAPCVCFLGGFLSCSSGLPVRRSPACVSLELFSGPLVLSAAVVPGSLIPLRCFIFRRLVSVPVCPRDSCGLVGFVLRTLRWCSAVSLLFVGLLFVMVQHVLFLFSVSSVHSWGRCSPCFPLFSHSDLLSARPFVLSPCPLGFSFLRVVCSCLLSPVGRLASPGSTRLWRPPVVRGALPLAVLVLCLWFVSIRLHSFLPLLLLRFVGSSTMCVFAYSSGVGFPGVVCSIVCHQSSSPLRCRGSVLFLRLRFVRRLSPSVVFFSAFAMRSPLSGSSVGYGFSHSIGTKA